MVVVSLVWNVQSVRDTKKLAKLKKKLLNKMGLWSAIFIINNQVIYYQ